MTASSKKKFVLAIIAMWYMAFAFVIIPNCAKYFFKEKTLLAELLAEVLAIGLPVAFFACYTPKKQKTTIFQINDQKLDKKIYFLALGLIVSVFLIGEYFSYIVYYVKTFKIIHNMGPISVPKINFLTLILGIITNALLPAIYEEILYRGMVADVVKKGNKFLTYVMPSIIFAICHEDLFTMAYTFVLGLILMWLYRKFNSIMLVIWMHFVNDLMSFTFSSLIMLPFSPIRILQNYPIQRQVKIILAIIIGILAIMAIISYEFFNKIKKYDDILIEEKEC